MLINTLKSPLHGAAHLRQLTKLMWQHGSSRIQEEGWTVMFTHPQYYVHRQVWLWLFCVTNLVRTFSITFYLIPLWCLIPPPWNSILLWFLWRSSPRSPLSHLRCGLLFLWAVSSSGEGESVSCISGYRSRRTWIRSCWWPSSIICGNLFPAGENEVRQNCMEWRWERGWGRRCPSGPWQ